LGPEISLLAAGTLLLTKLVIVLIAVVAREKSWLSSAMYSWLQVQSYDITL